MLTLGEVLGGRYRLDEEIGSGGMGSVFRGSHLVLDREVAVKVLHRHLAADDSFRARFLREPQMAARIRHPHIIAVHDAADDDPPYIVMDYVAGGDLRTLIRAERIDAAYALELVGQIAAALDAAHAHGLIHRDVKPANVLLGDDGVLLTDFGLARLSSGAADMTRTGIFLGTPYYAAPEQFEGVRVDKSADIYSLGCVLYECLTGAVPFAYDSEFRLGLAHREETPPRLSDLRPELGTRLDAVVAKAMAKQPGDRYETASAMVDEARAALGSLRGAETVIAPSPSLDRTTIDTLPPSPPTPPAPPPDATIVEPAVPPASELPTLSLGKPGGPNRRLLLLGGGAVALLLVLGGGLALALSGGSKHAAAPPVSTTAETTPTVTHPAAKAPNAFPTRTESLVVAAAGLKAASCRRAPRLGTFHGAAAAVACTSGDRRLTYGIFPTRARLDAAYDASYKTHVRIGHGVRTCGGTSPNGEDAYAVKGRPAGRILCFNQNGVSWIVWTRLDPLLLSAARQTGSAASLVAWWSRAGRTQTPIRVVAPPPAVVTPHSSTPAPTHTTPAPTVSVPEPPTSVSVPTPPS